MGRMLGAVEPVTTPPVTATLAAGVVATTVAVGGFPVIEPGVWGLVGAFVGGAFELSGALWGVNPAIDNARMLAISRFAIGCVFGSAVAQEFASPFQDAMRHVGVGMERGAVGFVLGLVALSAYDPVKKGLQRFIAKWFDRL